MRMTCCGVSGECLMGIQFWLHPGYGFWGYWHPSAMETLPTRDWQLFHMNSGSFPRK